uniref:Zinc knuckle CX2CX4HX4C domain-containing protein n=1 Tax=Quercus lobata TaxID=97700 RepID=A0A7N2LW23_QUELO
MRVRVMVDVSQPLCHGMVVTLDDSREFCVSFKYERLPNLSYWCGCLTHNDQDCDRWIESDRSQTDANKEYKAWLKASPWFGARNSIVEVPGFYSKMKEERPGQRRSDEKGNSTAARVTLTTPTSDMLRATYGNSLADLVKSDSFQNNSHSAFMSTDFVHIENNTTGPTHLHMDPGLFTLQT